jgi:peptidoglycan/LPS O-acetylase OafA/YrhL
MKRFQSIQIMRGIAATMVVLYHFGYSNNNFLAAFPSFGSLFRYGDLGVWMFFVISGFVIPYAMHSTSYRVNEAWPFLFRRIVRLEPAYIVSLFLAFVLAYAAARTPGYRGPPEPSLKDYLLQFVYLAPWFDVPWLDDVAWTLAIEFQFYLFMLLASPLLLSKPAWPKVLLFAAIVATSLIFDDKRALFHYLPSFALGFAVFLFYIGRIRLVDLLALGVLFVLVIAFETAIPTAVAAGMSAVFILAPIDRPVPILSFLGTISYSLYLIHTLIGNRIVNLAMRTSSQSLQLGGFAAAILASVTAAIALWYFVERPSHLRARMVKSARSTVRLGRGYQS